MPKYYSPDNQTLIVSSRLIEKGHLCFLSPEAGDSWGILFVIVLMSIACGIDALLKYLRVGWQTKDLSSGEFIFALILAVFLMRSPHIFYRIDSSIKRDGRISRSTKVLGVILNTKVFEKGHYKFIVEGNSEKVYGGPEGIDGTWEAHRMSVVDEAGRQFPLFIVPRNDGIKEFLKEFSNFTGFLPDVKLDS